MKQSMIVLSIVCAGALAVTPVIGAQNSTANDPAAPGRGHHRCGDKMGRLTKALDLTPDQQARIAPILQQSQSQIETARQESRQKLRPIMDNVRAQIRPLLTATQQQKFDEFRNARENRDRNRQQSPKDWSRRGERKDHAFGQMKKNLQLTPEQQAMIHPILAQARPQMKAIRQELRQKTDAIRNNTSLLVRPLLTQAQQEKWDAIQKAREDRRKAREEMRSALAKE